ncbi:MAG: TetR/AcrR family transcriptional regulator [Tabrizicola sp.]|nr:TetR/AcrR family transcriptional regulator [Tabrizicola sp.]
MTLIHRERPARTDTRERILAVAHDAIVAKGFDATSVEEIAAGAEISRAGFFYHFPDKNALARALIERQIIEEAAMLGGFIARASELSDDPLQQMLIIMRFMAEGYAEVPGGYVGCILASATYQDRLFDSEVKAANRRAHLAWRERFRGHFERIALAYPPREPVDAGDMADMLSAVIEGGMILARGMGDPQVLVRQVLQARQMVKAVYQRA